MQYMYKLKDIESELFTAVDFNESHDDCAYENVDYLFNC